MRKLCYYYQYLFYKYYCWNFSRNTDRHAYETGWFLLSLAEYANFLTLLIIIQLFTGFGFSQIFSHPKTVQSNLASVASGLIFIVINYFILIRNKKYVNTIEHFKDENQRSRIIGNIFALLYFFGSWIVAGVCAYILGITRN